MGTVRGWRRSPRLPGGYSRRGPPRLPLQPVERKRRDLERALRNEHLDAWGRAVAVGRGLDVGVEAGRRRERGGRGQLNPITELLVASLGSCELHRQRQLFRYHRRLWC